MILRLISFSFETVSHVLISSKRIFGLLYNLGTVILYSFANLNLDHSSENQLEKKKISFVSSNQSKIAWKY